MYLIKTNISSLVPSNSGSQIRFYSVTNCVPHTLGTKSDSYAVIVNTIVYVVEEMIRISVLRVITTKSERKSGKGRSNGK